MEQRSLQIEKNYVEINGKRIGMIIETTDLQNPVLLFLSGGPALPEYLLEYLYPTDLAQHFTVCYPSYWGTGLSYQNNIPYQELTGHAYIQDAHQITQYLKERFSVDKVFLMGHSFGTFISIKLAQAHPEDFYAYIAMSQITDQASSEKMAFHWMMNHYKHVGNEKMLSKFASYQGLSSQETLEKYLASPLRDKAMHELGVGTTREMKSVIKELFFPSFFLKAFSLKERMNIWRGKVVYRNALVIKESFQFNAFKEVKSLNLPVYFLAGRHDLTCNYALQEEYYHFLEAWDKYFYSFENSAHSPLFEEKDASLKVLIEMKEKYWSNK